MQMPDLFLPQRRPRRRADLLQRERLADDAGDLALEVGGAGVRKGRGINIEHILANDAVEVLTGEVVHSPASNAASDHHPVMVDFRIRRT